MTTRGDLPFNTNFESKIQVFIDMIGLGSVDTFKTFSLRNIKNS